MAVDELAKFTPSPDNAIWNAGTGSVSGSTVNWSGHGNDNILSDFNPIGKDKPHNNISPSMSGYMWSRTA